MAPYKPLSFLELLYIIDSTDEKTGESIMFKDDVEKKYKEVLDFVNKTGKSGEVNIKIHISLVDKDNDDVLALAEVTRKLQKVKNRVYLKQDEDGNIYSDSLEQRAEDESSEEPESAKKNNKSKK